MKGILLNRIFSAMTDGETEVLDQFEKDLELAKSEGSIDTPQYSISYSDDAYEVHDKINDEKMKVTEEGDEYIMEDVEQFSTSTEKRGAHNYDGVNAPDEPNKRFSKMSEKTQKLFSKKESKSFATYKNGKLIIRIGNYDVEFDTVKGKAKVLDEKVILDFNPSQSISKVLEDLKEKMTKAGLYIKL
jgi:hypothetical protein